jgi:hypothetical protein
LLAARDAGFSDPVTAVMRGIKAEGLFISFARAYGDWSRYPCREHLSELRGNVIEMTQLPTDQRGKNTADIALTVDAIDMICGDHRPERLVLVSGDRDFVPLVQRARRYGVPVMGVGVRGSVGAELVNACDWFLFLDDVVVEAPGVYEPDPPATAEEPAQVPERVAVEKPRQPVAVAASSPTLPSPTATPLAASPLDRPAAFRLLASTVEAILGRKQVAYGARVVDAMRVAEPRFDLTALGFANFREFVTAAMRQGLVLAEFSDVTDMRLTLPERSATPGDDEADDLAQVDDPHAAAGVYSRVLREDKGVPLIAWPHRKALVEFLFEALEHKPMTIGEMNDLLRAEGGRSGLSLPDRAYNKLTHTLNIARCFADERGNGYFEDLHTVWLRPALPVAAALRAMQAVYIEGIKRARPDLPLRVDGLTQWLYGDAADEHLKEVEQTVARLAPTRPDTIGDRFAGPLGSLR